MSNQRYSYGWDTNLFQYLAPTSTELEARDAAIKGNKKLTDARRAELFQGAVKYDAAAKAEYDKIVKKLGSKSEADRYFNYSVAGLDFTRKFVSGEPMAPGSVESAMYAQLQSKFKPDELKLIREEAKNYQFNMQQRMQAETELFGKRNNIGSTLMNLGSFAAMAAGAYGLGTAISGGTGVGITGWVSEQLGLSPAASAAVSAGSTASSVASAAGAASGAAGVAAGGAGIIDTLVSGAQLVGSIATAVGGTGLLDAYSTFNEASAVKAQAEGAAAGYIDTAESFAYQAGQASRNRTTALANYAYEQQRLISTQQTIARKASREQGATRATYAASGVDVSAGGSVQEVLIDSAMDAELDIALEGFQSRQKQRGYLIEMDALAAEEDFAKKNEERARGNAANAIKTGNEISDYLKTKGTIQGVGGAINTIGEFGNIVKSGKSFFDLFV